MPTRQTTSLPDVTQFSVADGNWDSNRGPVTGIVLHTMDGTVAGADKRFNDPVSKVSAHYGVGLDGKLYQWVDEDNVAYQAGNYVVNTTTIGIEHEDGGNYNGVRPDILYQKSAELIADICKFYDFPADIEHIFIHKNVIDKTFFPNGTACPDALDTDRIVNMAAAILNPPPVTPEIEPTVTPPVAPEAVPVQPEVAQTVSIPVQNTPAQTPAIPIVPIENTSTVTQTVPKPSSAEIVLPWQPFQDLPRWLVRLLVELHILKEVNI